MKQNWMKYGTAVYRSVLMLCLVAQLYLTSHFVTKERYEADRKEILSAQAKTEELITRMEERNKVNDRQDQRLEDHEGRIRSLEKKR